GLRHRAADHHIVDIGRLKGWHPAQSFANDYRRHLVRAHGPERAVWRLADGSPGRRTDYCFPHVKPLTVPRVRRRLRSPAHRRGGWRGRFPRTLSVPGAGRRTRALPSEESTHRFRRGRRTSASSTTSPTRTRTD